VRSGFWIVSDSVLTAAVSILTVLVMARLVTPEDFGTAAIVTGMTLLLNLYVEGLFHDALIQSRDDADRFGHALWFVEAIAFALVGTALVAALVLSGTPARLAGLAVGSLASLPFSGYIGVVNARERKALQYRRVAIASIVGRTSGCAVGIALALAGFGVWSLVLQTTLTAAVQALVLLAEVRWLPRPALAVVPLKALLRFAVPYALMHTVAGARLQVFMTLVAAFSGLTTAGYVNVAFRLTTTLQTALTTTLMNFGFPYLAAGARPELARRFAFVTKVVCATAVPAFVGLALVAPQLVAIAFGPEWTQVVLPMQILALTAAAGFLRLSGSFLVRVEGNVRYSLGNAIGQLAFIAAAMALVQPTDATTAVLIWAAPILVVLPVTVAVVRAVLGLSPLRQLAVVAPALAALAAMALATEAVGLAPLPLVVDLCARIACGAAAFALTLVAADGQVRGELRRAFAARRTPA
jgi:O-antigen/teichoic acid export membrane protein